MSIIDISERPKRAHKSTKILIVKLGWTETLVGDQGTTCSLGDVLRTTPLLHLFIDDHVTWLTDERAVQLLPGEPYIDELVVYGPGAERRLSECRFDFLINLESDSEVVDLLAGVKAERRCGLGHGYEGLPEMIEGKVWPEVLFQMVGAEYQGQPMVLDYSNVGSSTIDIGLNCHVGSKWPTKAWPTENWKRLAEKLDGKYTFEFQRHLNDLTGYIDWISRCRLLVTSDSLGLHIAQALGKKMVSLFGPTSSATIPLQQNNVFLHGRERLECQPCYRPVCDRSQKCMNDISVDQVSQSIERLLES